MPSIKITSAQWNAVDWTARDCEIAALLNLSRERVRQVRKQLNKPRSPMHNRRRVDRMASVNWRLSNQEIAKLIECTPQHVSIERRKRGIPRSPYPPTIQVKGAAIRAELARDMSISPTIIASRVGCCRSLVHRIKRDFKKNSSPVSIEPISEE